MITIHNLTLYGYEYDCPACDKMKELLKRHNMDYEFIKVKKGSHPFKTVPQLFMDSTWIGDYSMMKNHLEGG